jgi:hypothetical protein
MDALANILIIFFSVLIIGAALFITIRQLKRQRERAETFFIPENLPLEELRLFEDHLEYKVMARKSARYSDITRVVGASRRFSNRMRFEFHDRGLSFIALMVNAEEFQQVEQFLRSRGVPVETHN